VLAVAAALSRRLALDAEARTFPALQALAFWMRRTELLRLRDAFRRLEDASRILVPRGTVFHVPPANVDTLFVYSWLLAVLAGNRNVVRLSTRMTRQGTILCRMLNEELARQHDGLLAQNTIMLSYGHEAEISAALSSICDVRVIWGGDATVNAMRRVPLPPHAVEMTFPDRYSWAALRADAFLALDEAGRETLADQFYNDTFWFDQLGCSSPRTLVWVGDAARGAAAATLFSEAVALRVLARGYHVDVGSALAKRTFAFRAVLDQPVSRVSWVSNELALAELDADAPMDRAHPGGGFLFQRFVDSLTAIAGLLSSRDQTLAYFGFTTEEMRTFAVSLGSRSFDRIVPIGEALRFDRYWDGYDLLAQFTRQVTIGSSQS
jgi:Acyl-CoA reductase (LuxC)